jgi:hypothetical protein
MISGIIGVNPQGFLKVSSGLFISTRVEKNGSKVVMGLGIVGIKLQGSG